MADVVVLLHLTREDVWAPETRLLGPLRVTWFDVPGFGESRVPRGTPTTLPGLAGEVAISPPGFWSGPQAAAVCAEIAGLWTAVRLGRPVVALAGRSRGLRSQVWNRLVAAPDRLPREVMDSIVLGVPHHMRHLTADLIHGARTLRALPSYRVGPLGDGVQVARTILDSVDLVEGEPQ